MNQELTDITVVLDRSGSMSTVTDDIIGGFNSFVQTQRDADGDANLTLVQFDSQDPYEVIYQGVNVNRVKDLDTNTYIPRGATPLLDCVCRAINETGARLRGMPENQRPGKVIFVIITDGYENSSREHTREQLNNMVTHQRGNYDWQFVFIGADQNAIQEGKQYGFATGSSITFGKNAVGINAAYASLGDKVSSYRGGLTSNVSFDCNDRQAQASAGVDLSLNEVDDEADEDVLPSTSS